jgi:hypothetical protein
MTLRWSTGYREAECNRRRQMRLRHGWLVALLIVAGLALPACTRTSTEGAGGGEAARVEPIEGSEAGRVILSSDAARRIGIQTAPIRKARGGRGGGARLVIPYSAVLYDPKGDTWVYTNPTPLEFVRARISVDDIRGSRAFLSSSPPPGTEVVTVGASELLGIEYRVGGE